jgi:aminoglycoside phosphotransferase (APT) family kinase protein
MRRPSLSHNQVLADVVRAFPSVVADRAVFVPRGDSSWVYILTTRDRPRWVCKVHPQKDVTAVEAAVHAKSVVAERLRGRVPGVVVPGPVASATGEPLARTGDWLFQVQQFCTGEHRRLGELPAGRLERLGHLLALLHGLPGDAPDRDHRFLPGEHVPILLADAHARWPGAGFGPARAEFLALRDRALSLAVPGHDAPVLVHGDLVSANILVGRRSTAVVDWDGIHLAPREYDFATLAFDSPAALAPVVRAYEDAGGPALDPALVLLHAARYLLFGLEFHLRRAMSAGQSEQTSHDLDEAAQYVSQCEAWATLHDTVYAAVAGRPRRGVISHDVRQPSSAGADGVGHAGTW